MDDDAVWRKWANEGEISVLFLWRQAELNIARERKKIRDRCYQRMRWAAKRADASG